MAYIPLQDFLNQTKTTLETTSDSVIDIRSDFDRWNDIKKKIENSTSTTTCSVREIWWCSFGLNIGKEENGKNKNFERPVLIIKKLSKDTYLCAPLTSSQSSHRLRIEIPSFNKNSFVIISQIRTISNKRLLRKVAIISQDDFNRILKSIRKLFY